MDLVSGNIGQFFSAIFGVQSKVKVDENGVKWIKHYSSSHKILLVGEGDFSFSSCLADAFGSATNMTATSLDSSSFITLNYGFDAYQKIKTLKDKGCDVIHEVDATNMASRLDIGSKRFDRIVFNFPHAGFNKYESRQSQLQRHRNLVKKFLENARRMLARNGEVHVVHKTNGFFGEWRIKELAAQCGLHLVEEATFRLDDYPGYQNKYGSGGNRNFNCHSSITYKFAP